MSSCPFATKATWAHPQALHEVCQNLPFGLLCQDTLCNTHIISCSSHCRLHEQPKGFCLPGPGGQGAAAAATYSPAMAQAVTKAPCPHRTRLGYPASQMVSAPSHPAHQAVGLHLCRVGSVSCASRRGGGGDSTGTQMAHGMSHKHQGPTGLSSSAPLWVSSHASKV